MKKIILVTGGNRGIGLAICRQLAKDGHTVILGSRDIRKGEKAAATLQGDVSVVQLDVTNISDISNITKYTKKAYGKLDVLINNAGVGGGSTGAVDVSMEQVRQIMEVNFYGAWQLAQALIPLLKKSGDGRIINMSSNMGALNNLQGGYAGYRLSKTALNGLTLLLAGELRGSVKVNAMCPGWVRTDMGGKAAPRSVEEGADTAVWLATAEEIPNGKSLQDRTIIDW